MFQYPLRVEVGCNLTRGCGYPPQVRKVSVPSTGRSGLQRRVAWFESYMSSRVSVPSTGRSGLQHLCRLRMTSHLAVSVPSTGRSGLQLSLGSPHYPALSSFSTLYGSKWVATHGSGRHFLGAYLFQYPLRVEVGCNLPHLPCLAPCACFSTLYGSKWVATRYTYRVAHRP